MNLLVSDFDGTFYDENYQDNIEFVKNLDNFDFVIATGRNYKYLKEDLKINCKYYICNDGGYILDNNEKLIYKNYIDNDILNIICNRIKELNYDDYFIDYIDSFDINLKEYANKISIRIKDNNAEKDLKYLLNDLKGVYGYLSTHWINILNINSKKEIAIEKIININNYKNIYVVGNEINDYGMVKKYNGYLVGNNNKFNNINKFIDIKKKL